MSRITHTKTGNDAVDKVLGPVIEEIRDIQAQPMFGAKIIEDVELIDATENKVPHRLGKAPRKWFVGGFRNASSAGVINYGPTKADSNYLYLTSDLWGGRVTVDIIVI